MISNMLAALTMGMKRSIKKSVNYDKMRGLIQGTEENPTLP